MSNLTATTIREKIRRLEDRRYRDDKGELQRVSKYDLETYAKAKEATKTLLDSLNGGSREVVQAAIVQGILETHKYLQSQGIAALLHGLGSFGALTESESWLTDARNEAIANACSALRPALDRWLFWRD